MDAAKNTGINAGRVVRSTSLKNIKDNYGELHQAAKKGDAKSAATLVMKVANPTKYLRFRTLPEDAVFVPVIGMDGGSTNTIPLALASYAARLAGRKVDTSILQVAKGGHTGSSQFARFRKRVQFAGEVVPGKHYVLVDDHFTMGV